MQEINCLSLEEAERSAGWAQLCGSADLFASPEWLPVERSRVGPWVPEESHCVLAAAGDHVIAGVTTQRYGTAVEDALIRVDKMLSERPEYAEIPAGAMRDAFTPALMCGGWFNSRVLNAPDAADDQIATARHALVGECIEMARRAGCGSVYFPYLDERDVGLRRELAAAGFTELPAPVRYVFDSDYPDYDAYFHGVLRSHQRYRVVRERRRFFATGATTECAVMDTTNVTTIATLAHNLELKYGHHEKTLDQMIEWFREILRHNRTTVFTASLAGRMFAMVLWIHRRHRVYSFHYGFDYAIAAQVPHTYSMIVYRMPIAWACADPAIRYMEHGVGADEAKRSRGCFGVPQVLCVKPLDTAAEKIISRYMEAGDRLRCLAPNNAPG